ncbi:hypothetical protein Aspvir_004140 [Aspergillus viridinutans]|uniref:Uncharacterized protein n=1 Tax=Aspergillus viridinutans TaxID=75553 RepID=A0A9P3BVD1_ASPVI|nr:uncharacterized protein Aspvir_004140 [Aspergillus viridinutans]GIK00122.1 hypothetical protein Aspvir_004140 [Aspergillus viridinutans]
MPYMRPGERSNHKPDGQFQTVEPPHSKLSYMTSCLAALEALCYHRTDTAKTSSQAFVKAQFTQADEALQEFKERIDLAKTPKERYEICWELGEQVMLQKEVLEAQASTAWEVIESTMSQSGIAQAVGEAKVP